MPLCISDVLILKESLILHLRLFQTASLSEPLFSINSLRVQNRTLKLPTVSQNVSCPWLLPLNSQNKATFSRAAETLYHFSMAGCSPAGLASRWRRCRLQSGRSAARRWWRRQPLQAATPQMAFCPGLDHVTLFCTPSVHGKQDLRSRCAWTV